MPDSAAAADRRPWILVGAGGHARVIVDVLLARGEDVAGMLGSGRDYRGVPALDRELDSYPPVTIRVHVAIGANATRQRLGTDALLRGFDLPPIVSIAALVSPSASIDDGTVVMDRAVLHADAQVGAFSIVNTAAVVEHDDVIGRGVHIGPGSTLAGTVTVGDGTFLGAGTIAIPGVTIGAGAMVGAGSVVVSDIADARLAAGVPARERGAWPHD